MVLCQRFLITVICSTFLISSKATGKWSGIVSKNDSCISTMHQEWGRWEKWGEQPEGYYLNPILPADYSDLDCIKVEEDYYAITSTFQFSPGMTILHSRDLVNWEICGHAVDDLCQISDQLNYTNMNRYARGIWAGSIRYHNGRFYVFFGTPDEGFFMTSALRPEGPWEPLTPLLKEDGWDDCSAIWDEKGKGYFVGTCFKDGYKTYIFDMASDGRSIDKKSGRLIHEGNGREANKLIRHGKWYYLVFSEHRHGIGRYVMAKRARKITGPYKEEKQLLLPCLEEREPNQGGIIEGPDGNWYFLTHHGSGDWAGRIMSLLPVAWENGWPMMGTRVGDGIGGMTWAAKMPAKKGKNIVLQTSDDFSSSVINHQWQWNYQPRNEMFSLTDRPGWLRLRAFLPLEKNILKVGNVLTQRVFRTNNNIVTIRLDLQGMEDHQHVGLCHFSKASSSFGIVKENGQLYLESSENGSWRRLHEVKGNFILLRSVWGLDGLSHYAYSMDGNRFYKEGDVYQLQWGNYRGDRIGIFTFNDDNESGYVDVDFFHYEIE